MPRELLDGIARTLEGDVVRPFFAVELNFPNDEVLRFWTGNGLLYNTEQGLEYLGTGNALNFSSVEETSELSVKGVELTLSGVPSPLIDLAIYADYQGGLCSIYFGMFQEGSILTESSAFQSEIYLLQEDGDRFLLETGSSSFTEIFTGYMDQMNIKEEATTSTIILTAENRLIDLERPRPSRFTSGYQKTLFPNDRGFEYVESLQSQQLFWGRSG